MLNNTVEPFTLYLNSSLLKHSCLRKVFYKAILGLTRKPGEVYSSYKADFGNAIHRGLKAFYAGKSGAECVAASEAYYIKHVRAPSSSFYTLDYCRAVIGIYIAKFGKADNLRPLVIEGEPLLEMQFEEEIYRSPRLVVKLCGTIDFVGYVTLFGRDYLVICDHKTTGFLDIKKFFKPFELSAQGMLYVQQVVKKFPQLSEAYFLINGIFLSESRVPLFQRSDLIKFDESLLSNYMEHILETADRVDRALERDCWPTNFNACPGSFNFMCEYLPLCKVARLDDRKLLQSELFDQSPYNPLSFQEDED